ncbi:MAG: response regulator transcription factor [Prevotella sp.]|nr:response regulator transcription factor [Prevotella sp.]
MANYILADNQELTGFAWQSLLKQDERNIIYHATDRAGLLQLLKEHEDSIVILDYTLFDFADEDSLLIVSERFTMTSWILVSDELSKGFLRKVIYSSHAFSVVFKDEPMRTIREAIRSASDGNRYVSQRATEMILTQQQQEEEPAVLTETEIEIVKAIAKGKTTKEIANERFSSVHTINTHRKNIFRKLGINTAHEAVRYALRAGWVDPSDFYI